MVISISSLAEGSRVQMSRPGFITSKLGSSFTNRSGSEFSPILQAQSDFFLSHFMLNFLLETNLFQVKDDFHHVFRNTFDGSEFMIGSFNLDPNDRISFQANSAIPCARALPMVTP